MNQDAKYWEDRWQDGQTGWDIGFASPPLLSYFDTLTDKDLRILIPGAGNAYEAIALHRKGFTQVFVCDWAPSAFENLRQAAPDFPIDQLLVGDFFELDGRFDLMIEQTFFCAIPPIKRADYVKKAHQLLQPEGRLVGLLFDRDFGRSGPPYGGNKEEYKTTFQPLFELIRLKKCTNSIAPRLGFELFIEAVPQS